MTVGKQRIERFERGGYFQLDALTYAGAFPERDTDRGVFLADVTAQQSAVARHRLREAANLAALSNEGLEALAHRLIALQDFADAQTTRQLSRNNYVLSIVAAVFLPLSFVTGLFGVNIAGMPGMTWPGAFALLCGALLAMALTSIAILKWLRLL